MVDLLLVRTSCSLGSNYLEAILIIYLLIRLNFFILGCVIYY